MGRGEFEDIFEECLSALLEGRRSVEDSLSLYPAWRGRLEPLLRTVEETAAGLNQSPPHHVKERGLQRFLEAARVRRRVRQMLSPYAAGTPWWRWASTGLAAVVVVGVLAFASATLMAGDGRNLSETVSVRPYSAPQATATPNPPQSSLDRVQQNVAELESSVRQGEPVGLKLLEELDAANSDLAADLDGSEEMGLVERVAAVSATSRQYGLLQSLQGRSEGLHALAVEESLASAEDVLEKLGAPTPGPSPTATAQPTASPSATASPQPSPPPTATAPTPTPSPVPAR